MGDAARRDDEDMQFSQWNNWIKGLGEEEYKGRLLDF